jgi:hypothetical protein
MSGESKRSIFGKNPPSLVEGIDFYYENGLMVLTAKFLKDRGYCCGNICRHCPYTKEEQDAALKKKFL